MFALRALILTLATLTATALSLPTPGGSEVSSIGNGRANTLTACGQILLGCEPRRVSLVEQREDVEEADPRYEAR